MYIDDTVLKEPKSGKFRDLTSRCNMKIGNTESVHIKSLHIYCLLYIVTSHLKIKFFLQAKAGS